MIKQKSNQIIECQFYSLSIRFFSYSIYQIEQIRENVCDIYVCLYVYIYIFVCVSGLFSHAA